MINLLRLQRAKIVVTQEVLQASLIQLQEKATKKGEAVGTLKHCCFQVIINAVSNLESLCQVFTCRLWVSKLLLCQQPRLKYFHVLNAAAFNCNLSQCAVLLSCVF